MRHLGITAVFTFLLDQVSKWFVVHWLNLFELGEINTWAPYLNLRMAWNNGVNFGLFAHSADAARWILIAVALGISGAVLVWVRKEQPKPLGMISAGLLLGGAMGNVVDRVLYGAVADFLNMSCCGINNPYSFNVADITIFLGAFGLVLFTGEKTPPK
jgi:signal peptidase II